MRENPNAAQWFDNLVAMHRQVKSESEYRAIWDDIEQALAFADDAIAIALSRIGSEDPSARAITADILGQIGSQVSLYHRPAVKRLVAASKVEDNEDVRWSIVYALAHLADPSALAAVVSMKRSQDPDVRYQVAQALPRILTSSQKDVVIRTLLELSTDPDVGVRQKAEEGIGELSDPRF